MELGGSVPNLFYLKIGGMAEVSKNVGTVSVVREEWMMAEMRGTVSVVREEGMMAEMRGTSEGSWALTGCVGRGSS